MNEERDRRELEWRMRLIEGDKVTTAEFVERYLADIDDTRSFIRNSAAKMLGKILVLEDVPNADGIVAKLTEKYKQPSGPESLGEDEEFYHGKELAEEAIQYVSEKGLVGETDHHRALERMSHITGGHSAVGFDSISYHAAESLYEYAAGKPGNGHVLEIVRLFFEDDDLYDDIFEAWRIDFPSERVGHIVEKNADSRIAKELLEYFAGMLDENDDRLCGLAMEHIAVLVEVNPGLISNREDIADALLGREGVDSDMEGYLVDIAEKLLYVVPRAQDKVLDYLKRRSSDECRGIRETARTVLIRFGEDTKEFPKTKSIISSLGRLTKAKI